MASYEKPDPDKRDLLITKVDSETIHILTMAARRVYDQNHPERIFSSLRNRPDSNLSSSFDTKPFSIQEAFVEYLDDLIRKDYRERFGEIAYEVCVDGYRKDQDILKEHWSPDNE